MPLYCDTCRELSVMLFPSFLPHIFVCLQLCLWLLRTLNESKPQSSTFPNCSVWYHPPPFGAVAVTWAVSLTNWVLVGTDPRMGCDVPLCHRCSLAFLKVRFSSPELHPSLWATVCVGTQPLLPVCRQNVCDLFLFGWVCMAASLTQKSLQFQSSDPYFKMWNWYSLSKEDCSEFKISKTIYGCCWFFFPQTEEFQLKF